MRIGRALFVPEGCAHGFLTLTDDSEVLYQISEAYAPDAAARRALGRSRVRDHWPGDIVVINERDASYPDFIAAECSFVTTAS